MNTGTLSKPTKEYRHKSLGDKELTYFEYVTKNKNYMRHMKKGNWARYD